MPCFYHDTLSAFLFSTVALSVYLGRGDATVVAAGFETFKRMDLT